MGSKTLSSFETQHKLFRMKLFQVICLTIFASPFLAEPIPMGETFHLTDASCQERKDSLVAFMTYQLGHHTIIDKDTSEACQYDANRTGVQTFVDTAIKLGTTLTSG